MTKQSEYQTALSAMKAELLQVKAEAEEVKGELDELSPEELTFELSDDLDELEPADKEKAKAIKTNEDAVKVLNEAKSDFDKVIDFLDGQAGLTQETETTASIPNKRMNEKFASDIKTLAKNSDKAIADARDAINHWSFLLRIRKDTSLKTSAFSQAIDTVKEASKFVKWFNKITGNLNKESTAVPPTGAVFTGDKWPEGKDSKGPEDRNWQGGATRFKKDVTHEKTKTNPSMDDRLKYRQENVSPDALLYVNAKFVKAEKNEDSYWEVVDSKTGTKLLTPTFANLPDSIGDKDERGWKIFSSANYGEALVNNILQYGIKATGRVVAGKVENVDVSTLRKVAADESKSNVRKYYSDAYGDSTYAKDLTSGGGGKGGSKPAYKPKYEHVEDNKGDTKDGTGKLSVKKKVVTEEEKRVIAARAQKTIELARKFASRGAIPFTKTALLAKAEELMDMNDEAFTVAENTIDSLPVINEAALKSASIPDTEKGIVGNEQQGVQNQQAQVNTENIDPGVKSDAKIAKKANLIPQMSNASEVIPDYTNKFTTTRTKLEKLGFDVNKIRKPSYRKG